MVMKFAVDTLRKKAERLHREYEALCVVTNTLTISDRNRIDLEKEKIHAARKTELPKIIAQLEHAIFDRRKDWGFRVPTSKIVEILARVESAPKGELVRISKAGISEICAGYEKYWIIFNDLPAHTLIE